jgi:hypothetical protein
VNGFPRPEDEAMVSDANSLESVPSEAHDGNTTVVGDAQGWILALDLCRAPLYYDLIRFCGILFVGFCGASLDCGLCFGGSAWPQRVPIIKPPTRPMG